MDEQRLLEERKKKALTFFKKKPFIIVYALVALVTYLAVYIRTRNLYGLKDVTTNDWTLGPDLDPFLFLRWADYIVQHGSIMAYDAFRYVPLGFQTSNELVLLPYMIAWFHNILSFFGFSESVNYSAVIFPVFMFALTVVAFFLFVREVFKDKLGNTTASIVGLIGCFFLSTIPALLPRTIAGIPEKESVGFLFIFLCFYFFIKAWKARTLLGSTLWGTAAGIASAWMGLVWGGFVYIILTIALATLIAFIFGQTTRNRLAAYSLWIGLTIFLMSALSTRYDVFGLVKANIIAAALFVIVCMVLELALNATTFKERIVQRFPALPFPIIAFICALLAAFMFALVFFGPGYIMDNVRQAAQLFTVPVVDRLGRTVAENAQPYFSEWAANFGPILGNTPLFALFFWLMIGGTLFFLFTLLSKFNMKERIILTAAYGIFLAGVIFSRYSPSSILNGQSFISSVVYLGGALILLIITFRYYRRHYNADKAQRFKELDYGYVLALSFMLFSLLAARSAVRLIMGLVPPAALMAAFLIVSSALFLVAYFKKKQGGANLTLVICAAVVVVAAVYSGYFFYNASVATAQSYIPSTYTQQWQLAMSWVRENTSETAVFGHWWDYGYWVQSIGKRATVLDGGNALPYWNHLMGRHALTSTDSKDAATFLYAHNVTHFLIDSSDIGKYTAFSSIGSDENYDRRSWFGTFMQEPNSRPTKNKTTYIYTGGFSLDSDVVYNLNGTTIFLPGVGGRNLDAVGSIAGLGAILIEVTSEGRMLQPHGVFIYQGQQYTLPLRYAYANGTFIDFGSGVESGVYIMPRIDQRADGNVQVFEQGALLYLSDRTVNSQLARLYLYGEEDHYFRIAHVESSYIARVLRQNSIPVPEVFYFNGLQGPIMIWEVSYPGIELNPEYLKTTYPSNLNRA